jgi:hypothetical protein
MLARSLRAIALLVLRPTAIAKAQTTTRSLALESSMAQGLPHAFQSKDSKSPLPMRDLRALHVELANPADTDAWLELDDIQLY